MMFLPRFRVTWLLPLAAVLSLGCNDDEAVPDAPVRSVRYEVVSAPIADHHATFSGVSRSSEQSRLSFRVAGPVSSVHARVGQQVEAGELLAELDSRDLSLRAAEAGSSVAQARAQARQAQAQYERVRTLYEAQGASRSELDAARTSAQTAQTGLRAASSRAAVSRNQTGYARLVAPSAGRISLVSLEAGENVNPGQTVIVLESGARQEVTVSVPENVIAEIESGSSVQVRFAALDAQVVPGTVFEVGVSAERSTYLVTVRLDEEPESLRPGMAADVTFSFAHSDEEPPPIVVRGVAVAADTDGTFVFVVELGDGGFGTVHRRAVDVGELVDRGIVINEGLEAGEFVVTAGVSRISEGLRVRVPPLEPEPSTDEEAEGR